MRLFSLKPSKGLQMGGSSAQKFSSTNRKNPSQKRIDQLQHNNKRLHRKEKMWEPLFIYLFGGFLVWVDFSKEVSILSFLPSFLGIFYEGFCSVLFCSKEAFSIAQEFSTKVSVCLSVCLSLTERRAEQRRAHGAASALIKYTHTHAYCTHTHTHTHWHTDAHYIHTLTPTRIYIHTYRYRHIYIHTPKLTHPNTRKLLHIYIKYIYTSS